MSCLRVNRVAVSILTGSFELSVGYENSKSSQVVLGGFPLNIFQMQEWFKENYW